MESAPAHQRQDEEESVGCYRDIILVGLRDFQDAKCDALLSLPMRLSKGLWGADVSSLRLRLAQDEAAGGLCRL